MKKVCAILLLITQGLILYSQTGPNDKMPVTSDSKKALTFYNEAMGYSEKVNLSRSQESLMKALKEDPDFFMANYQMALYYSGQADIDNFIEYAHKAENCKVKLSDAEEYLRTAIGKLSRNQSADVTEIGKKLVEMYPRDINAYNNLFYFQSFINDLNGELETLTRALKIANDKAPVYNSLGYVYMGLKRNEEAEAAFDKYIELDPKNPNVYDSKGDFYLNSGNFKRAYELYMKSYSIDSSWGYDKAQRAKQLYEMKEGKKLDIITL